MTHLCVFVISAINQNRVDLRTPDTVADRAEETVRSSPL